MDDSISSDDEAKLILDSTSDSSSGEEENKVQAILAMIVKLPKQPKERQNYIRIAIMDSYDDEEFEKRFRFPKLTVYDIVNLVESDLVYFDNRNNPLTPLTQVLIALRYYAVGSFQIVSGDLFGVHQVTCGRIAKRVSIAIAKLAKTFIKMPETEAEINQVKLGFYSKYEFPNVLGVVDGTHIPIFSPGGDNAEIYRNRKGYFSINTQVVCDANLKFINVDARWPGSVHDQTIFNFSYLFAKLESGRYGNGYILGDSGYGCRKYLLTPVQNVLSDAERKYNFNFVRTRQIVERAIGVWKRRFPILSTKMQVDVNFAVIIITATAVLHNLAIDKNVAIPPSSAEMLQSSNNENGMIHRYSGADTTRRSELIRNFFST